MRTGIGQCPGRSLKVVDGSEGVEPQVTAGGGRTPAGTLGIMSINDAERRQTAEELTALRELLPATNEELAHRLGYGTDQLAAVLDMRPAVDPREVWRVRDFLVAIAAARGIQLPEFSVLKQARRRQAQMWFGSWEVPDPAGL